MSKRTHTTHHRQPDRMTESKSDSDRTSQVHHTSWCIHTSYLPADVHAMHMNMTWSKLKPETYLDLSVVLWLTVKPSYFHTYFRTSNYLYSAQIPIQWPTYIKNSILIFNTLVCTTNTLLSIYVLRKDYYIAANWKLYKIALPCRFSTLSLEAGQSSSQFLIH